MVFLEGERSEGFSVDQKVAQGYSLSLILYSIFFLVICDSVWENPWAVFFKLQISPLISAHIGYLSVEIGPSFVKIRAKCSTISLGLKK